MYMNVISVSHVLSNVKEGDRGYLIAIMKVTSNL